MLARTDRSIGAAVYTGSRVILTRAYKKYAVAVIAPEVPITKRLKLATFLLNKVSVLGHFLGFTFFK